MPLPYEVPHSPLRAAPTAALTDVTRQGFIELTRLSAGRVQETHLLLGARMVPLKGTAPDTTLERVPSAAMAAASDANSGLAVTAAAREGYQGTMAALITWTTDLRLAQ